MEAMLTESRLLGKYRKNFKNAEIILYLDVVMVTCVYICRSTLNTLKMSTFYYVTIILQ